LKNFFNFVIGAALPTINTMVFSTAGIELPSIAGLSFKDTDLYIKQGFIQFEMNPLFDEQTRRFLGSLKYLR